MFRGKCHCGKQIAIKDGVRWIPNGSYRNMYIIIQKSEMGKKLKKWEEEKNGKKVKKNKLVDDEIIREQKLRAPVCDECYEDCDHQACFDFYKEDRGVKELKKEGYKPVKTEKYGRFK